MKITMYELLGMVKDGKQPRKIKYRDNLFEYRVGVDDYRADEPIKYHGNYLFHYLFEEEVNFLNDEVEILDDEKKKKSKVPIKLYGLEMLDEDMSHEIAIAKQRYNNGRIRTKINEIIDYLEKQIKGE